MIALCASITQAAAEARFLPACRAAGVESDIYLNDPNVGVVAAYDVLYRRHRSEEIQIYAHDDVEFADLNWPALTAAEFLDPAVAIVGAGGATGMGTPDIYKRPYRIEQLVRTGYASNQIGWEIHGEQLTKPRDVAVVDGFFMAVRTAFLDQIGGWSWIQSRFHLYDEALALEALRRGWRIRAIPIEVDHHGGGTSTRAEYVALCREFGTTPEREHAEPHRWLYSRYRDLLPVRL